MDVFVVLGSNDTMGDDQLYLVKFFYNVVALMTAQAQASQNL